MIRPRSPAKWTITALLCALTVPLACAVGELKNSFSEGSSQPTPAVTTPDADAADDARDAAGRDAERAQTGPDTPDAGSKVGLDASVEDSPVVDATTDSGAPDVSPTCPTCPQCTDGIDNDGDGLIDWGIDLGCTAIDDDSEGGRDMVLEHDRFYAYEQDDPSSSRRVFVSKDGSDSNPCDGGISRPKATISSARACIRPGFEDWLFIRAGDDYSESPRIDHAGISATRPTLVSSYYPDNDPNLPRPLVDGIRLSHDHQVYRDLELKGRVLSNGTATGLIFEGLLMDASARSISYSTMGFGRRGGTVQVRHCVLREADDHGIYTSSPDATFIWDVFIHNPGQHAVYGTRGKGGGGWSGPLHDGRYNLLVDDDGYGNGLMYRPGGTAYRNACHGVPFECVTMGTCDDGGNRGTCGSGECGPCIEKAIIDSTFMESMSWGGSESGIKGDQMSSGATMQLTDSCSRPNRDNVGYPSNTLATDVQQASVGLEEYYAAVGGSGDLWDDWADCKRTANLGGNVGLGKFCDVDAFFDWLYANSECSDQYELDGNRIGN